MNELAAGDYRPAPDRAANSPENVDEINLGQEQNFSQEVAVIRLKCDVSETILMEAMRAASGRNNF